MITAFAPATVANVAVGFDILGFAVPVLGDKVTIEKITEGVVIDSITGVKGIPLQAEQNTAGYALLKMIEGEHLNFGFRLSIAKGIPLSSGLGGSAASAVAAVVGANALLDTPLDNQNLLYYAIQGESIASGMHGDNVAPSLYGGLTAFISNDYSVINLPIPDIYCVLAHPDIAIKTKDARAIIHPTVTLQQHIEQSMQLVQFLAGCYSGGLFSNLQDQIIEPQRAHLIPHFTELQQIAQEEGALIFSISGAGPTMFALADKATSNRIIERYNGLQLPYALTCWLTKISQEGARIL